MYIYVPPRHSLWVKNLEGLLKFLSLLKCRLFPLLNKVDELMRMKAVIYYNGRRLFSLPPWLIQLMNASMTLTIFNKRT